MRFFSAFLIVLFFSCSEPKQHIYIHNTEQDTTWINEQTIIEVENAHSGKKVALTDSLNPYSLGLRKTLSSVGKGEPRAAAVRLWVFAMEPIVPGEDVALVSSVDGNPPFWQGPNVSAKIGSAGKWILIEERVEFPENVDRSKVFTTYLLNNTGKKILVDDFQVEFIDK